MEMEMRIIGIDPGIRLCGYACLDTNADEHVLCEAGVIRTTSQSPLHEKLNQIAKDIKDLLRGFVPEVVAVEELYSHYIHPRTAILMGHARGVILQKCAESSINVQSYSATRIKKSITGNGKASKQQMQKAIQTLLSLSSVPEPSDVADAIAAALCCANSLRSTVVA
jgi:crossover junction endodeoxyribonuclease RuvC